VSLAEHDRKICVQSCPESLRPWLNERN